MIQVYKEAFKVGMRDEFKSTTRSGVLLTALINVYHTLFFIIPTVQSEN
jgi:hypothetical protein